MSSNPYTDFLPNLGVGVLIVFGFVLYLLAAIYAFRVRRALLVPLYRNQALWIGVGSVFWVYFYLVYGISFTLQTLTPSLQISGLTTSVSALLFASLYFGLVFFFAWIDTMARIARNSDPRNRDVLRWSRLRLLMWASIGAGIALGSAFIAPGVLVSNGGNPVNALVLFYAYSSPIFFLTSGVGALVLLTSASRSGDVMLRKQLRWLGLFILVLFLNVSTTVIAVAVTGGFSGGFSLTFSGPTAYVGLGVEGGITLSQGLILYKAAHSLVPKSRFSQVD